MLHASALSMIAVSVVHTCNHWWNFNLQSQKRFNFLPQGPEQRGLHYFTYLHLPLWIACYASLTWMHDDWNSGRFRWIKQVRYTTALYAKMYMATCKFWLQLAANYSKKLLILGCLWSCPLVFVRMSLSCGDKVLIHLQLCRSFSNSNNTSSLQCFSLFLSFFILFYFLLLFRNWLQCKYTISLLKSQDTSLGFLSWFFSCTKIWGGSHLCFIISFCWQPLHYVTSILLSALCKILFLESC